jgi:hypothetical protein
VVRYLTLEESTHKNHVYHRLTYIAGHLQLWQMSIIAIQSQYTSKHNTLTPYYNALHVWFHQNHHQTTLLQNFNIISTFATCNSFVSEISLECSICFYVINWWKATCSRLLNGISVVLDGVPNLYLNHSKHNEINMNKIARPQPVIRRRCVGWLVMNSTSRSASGQEYELCEMPSPSTLRPAFLLYELRNVRTWRDVHCMVLVCTNTVINEAFYKICFIKNSRIKFVPHL